MKPVNSNVDMITPGYADMGRSYYIADSGVGNGNPRKIAIYKC